MASTAIKNTRVDFRLSSEQKALLEQGARLSGLSLTEYVLSSSLSAAAETVRERSAITLSESAWNEFVRLLDSDHQPTPEALAAVARYNAGRVDGARYVSETDA